MAVEPSTSQAPPASPADFLRAHAPFDQLAPSELEALAAGAVRRAFPRDVAILSQGGEPSDHLYVILTGSVRMTVRAGNGDEIILDMRGAGQHYGLSSMLRGQTLITVAAAEDTECWLFPRQIVLDVLGRNAAFGEALVQASIGRYLEHSLRQLQDSGPGSSESALLRLPARALVKRPAVVGHADLTIQEAARRMHVERVSALIVVGDDERPIGIVTDRDLRSQVVAAGRDIEGPVSAIMSTPLITVDGQAGVMDALLLLLDHDIHHLPVEEHGRVIGVATGADLVLLQGSSPVAVAGEIARQTTVAGLAAALQRAHRLVYALFREGAHPSNVARVLAEIGDRVTLKLLALAEAELGAAPVPFGWAVVGGEGRREQTFQTDKQDLIAYAASTPGDAAATDYFTALGAFMQAAFRQLGILETTAGRPPRARSWPEWRDVVRGWVASPQSDSELTPAHFDLRPVAGAAALPTAVRDLLHREALARPDFVRQLAALAVRQAPPGERETAEGARGSLDLLRRGTLLVVDLVRVLAIAHDIREANTLDRLRALTACGALSLARADDLRHTHEFLLLLRLRHQHAQLSRGATADNIIAPESLSPIDRATLREASRIVARQQGEIARRFGVERGG